jgi:hypothetical protein
MIYGSFHRSREVDVVVWDELNYMSLPLLDHSFFFAESVRLALECRSTWTSEEMHDVLSKSRAVRDIVPWHEPTLEDTVIKLAIEIEALRTGTAHSGLLIAPHHIGTAAIFLNGGANFGPSFLTQKMLESADEEWPDALILLEPGRVVLKRYAGGEGTLQFYDFGDDSLLVFTNALLTLLEERSVITESPFFLWHYIPTLAQIEPTATVNFRLTRPIPERVPLWR